MKMILLPYMIAIPLAAAFIVPLAGRRFKMIGDILLTISAAFLVWMSLLIVSSVVTTGPVISKMGNVPLGAGIILAADSLSALMLITVNTIAFLVSLYATNYMKEYTDQWKFNALFLLMLTGMNGVLIASDLFSLYVFMELAAISGYFLVAFGVDQDSLEASFKYAVMGAMASAFILLGIAFLYGHASTLNMAGMAGVLSGNPAPSKLVLFVSVLFIMGFGLKAALVPFHSWLPYAHSSAPAPVSAMLSGISIKVIGIYALARILFNVLGIGPMLSFALITLAVLSMATGAFLAFGQSDIKRLFAYSSISQIGYIALGLGIATPLSIFGALFYLLNHSIIKSLLFLNSGAIEHVAETRDLTKIRGVLSTEPVTGYTMLIGALSISGIPPLGGFWAKLVIIFACVQSGHPALALVAILVSILTLSYYFKALTPVLFGLKPGLQDKVSRKSISLAMGIPMAALAILTVASVALLLPNAGNVLLKATAGVLTSGSGYANIMAGIPK